MKPQSHFTLLFVHAAGHRAGVSQTMRVAVSCGSTNWYPLARFLDRLGSCFSVETAFKHQYEALNNEVEIFQSQSLSGRGLKLYRNGPPI